MNPQTQEIVATEASWSCACPSEHRPTITRAWCSACGEWCYPEPGMGCVRGELARAEDRVALLEKRGRDVIGWLGDGSNPSGPDDYQSEALHHLAAALGEPPAEHPKEPE